MPEVAAQATEQKQEEKKVPTSVGKIQSVDLHMNNGKANGNGKAAVQEVEKTAQTETQEENKEIQTNAAPAPEFSEEQLREFFKSKNINFDGGIDALKEKLEYKPPVQTKELTPEEIKAKEIAQEKRELDLWVELGGKAEDFFNLKKLTQADDNELTESEIRRELKAEGFATKEEQDEIIKHRYFQLELDKIEQEEDESDEDFKKRKETLEKKVKYGAKKLANRSTYIKNEAAKTLKGLAKELELRDKEAQDEVSLTQKVDDYFKSLPKETVIELQLGDKKVDPINFKVSDTAVQKAMAILRNPQERNNFLFTQDGSINLPNISELLINKFEQEERDKRIYAEATTRNTNEFKKMFPYTSAQGVGVGGVIQKSEGKGKIASYGKTERVIPANT